jgi:ubiquinone/menaquinone biosynthesis C-methylase UbiE
MASDLTARLLGQFGHPSGGLGHLAGLVMARKNRAVNALAVELLAPGAGERVLDVGCGPGVGMAQALAKVRTGFVLGVDAAPAMVAQARARNRAALRAGRAEVLLASADALPVEAASVDAAFSVNSLPHWREPQAGLAAIARALRPGGRLVLALRRRVAGTGRFDRRRYGADDARIEQVIRWLTDAGLVGVRIDEREPAGEATAFLQARR